ncbi:MAG: hypothetical protein HQL90_15900 [Magnetococcales bacterium]|nr:hypothetical protein [Magnetococcales bacterium]
MMMSNVGPVTTARTNRSTVSSSGTSLLLPGDRSDVVDFSPEARALAAGQLTVSQPAALLTGEQVQVKMGLLRTLLETLFGRQERATAKDTPEAEIVKAVLDEPVTQEAMLTLQKNGWIS